MENMRRKDYKHNVANFFMVNEKGQVAIFVIVAVIIVAILLVILLYPRLPLSRQGVEVQPISYLRSCIEPDLMANIAELANTGGYENPEGYLEYNGDKIKYFCYTAEYYKTCVVQQPLIKEHFEEEISRIIKVNLDNCMQNLKKEYEKRGYDVSFGNANNKVSINPGNVLVSFLTPMTIKKDSSTKSFDGFDVEFRSEMYDLLLTSVSIVDYEATYGDSETTLYMKYNPELKVDKIKLNEGSKIYRLTNTVTNENFTFASRSLVWPPGYG